MKWTPNPTPQEWEDMLKRLTKDEAKHVFADADGKPIKSKKRRRRKCHMSSPQS